jgi:hypothetical protein
LSLKKVKFNYRFNSLRFRKKRDEEPWSTRLKWHREEQSIRFSLNFKEINKKCSIRNRWHRKHVQEMKKVSRNRSKCEETPLNTSIS